MGLPSFSFYSGVLPSFLSSPSLKKKKKLFPNEKLHFLRFLFAKSESKSQFTLAESPPNPSFSTMVSTTRMLTNALMSPTALFLPLIIGGDLYRGEDRIHSLCHCDYWNKFSCYEVYCFSWISIFSFLSTRDDGLTCTSKASDVLQIASSQLSPLAPTFKLPGPSS